MRNLPVLTALIVALTMGAAIQAGDAAASPGMCRELRGSDAAAKELARTAETVAETYATDHEGYYRGLSLRALRRYESSVQISRAQAAHEHSEAYMYAATAIESGDGYILRTRASDGDTYTVTRRKLGSISFTAEVHGKHCDG